MYRSLMRWAVPPLVMLIILGFVVLPVFGQRAGPQATGKSGQANELVKLAELVKLTEAGQLTVRAAIELAEKHTKGRALQATCEIRRGQTRSQDLAGTYLVYEVCCYADHKILDVRIDGKERKVLEVRERKSPKTDEKTKP